MSAARAPQGFRRSGSRAIASHPAAQVQRAPFRTKALSGESAPTAGGRFGAASAAAALRKHGSPLSMGDRATGGAPPNPPRNLRFSSSPAAAREGGRDGAPASLKPAIRIRYVLLAAFVPIAAIWTYPRGMAAWRLQGVATQLADYALCMAGP